MMKFRRIATGNDAAATIARAARRCRQASGIHRLTATLLRLFLLGLCPRRVPRAYIVFQNAPAVPLNALAV